MEALLQKFFLIASRGYMMIVPCSIPWYYKKWNFLGYKDKNNSILKTLQEESILRATIL